MEKIKIDLKSKSVEDKVFDAEAIGTLMAADPNATIQTQGNALLTGANVLNTKKTEQTDAQAVAAAKTEAVHTTETALDKTKRKAAEKTMDIYPDNPEKWKALGWKLTDPNTPVGELPAPTDLSLTSGDGAGELDAHWDKVEGAKVYNIRTSTNIDIPIMDWPIKKTSTKSSATITGLTSGTKYWVAVTAIGTAGESSPSDPAGKVAQ